jgi:gas vesicle protein
MAAVTPALINGASTSKSFEYGVVKLTPSRYSLSNLVWQNNRKPYGHMSCKRHISRAEYDSGRGRGSNGGDFLAGFFLGGAVFGALGYLFAPQISRALWTGYEDGLWKKLPKRMDDDASMEKTRKTLNEKIAQLNAAIDEVSSQLRAEDDASEPAVTASEGEPAT